MNQSARTGVPVFADTTARDAGFGGSGEKTLAEGQLCYLEWLFWMSVFFIIIIALLIWFVMIRLWQLTRSQQ